MCGHWSEDPHRRQRKFYSVVLCLLSQLKFNKQATNSRIICSNFQSNSKNNGFLVIKIITTHMPCGSSPCAFVTVNKGLFLQPY